VAPLERFEEDELRAARLLLEEEAQAMRAALGHPLLDPVDDAPVRRMLQCLTLPCTLHVLWYAVAPVGSST